MSGQRACDGCKAGGGHFADCPSARPVTAASGADRCPEWAVTYRCELPAGHEGWHRGPGGQARGTATFLAASGAEQPTLRDRYRQCDDTCTVDCGACKGQGRPTLRDQLAGVLPHRAWCGTFHAAIRSCTCLADRQHDADLLLPLIEADQERAKAEAAAEALEDAATDAGLPGVFPSTQRWLLARAAALRSNAKGDRS